MNKYILFGFILVLAFLFVVSVVPAGALPVQSTATPDYRTPPPTPVPATLVPESLNFSCPAGTPSGYGSVQADPGWLASCGHCLPEPTEYPTFDFNNPVHTNITCGAGLPCTQVNSNTIYFQGLERLSNYAFGEFSLVGELGTGRDVYIYYRYAGYSIENLGTAELSMGNQIVHEIEGEVRNYVDYPVDNLPSMYTYEYYLQNGISHRVVNGVNFSPADDTEPIVQNFGCTRIYVSTVEFSDWDTVTCELTDPEFNTTPEVVPTLTGEYLTLGSQVDNVYYGEIVPSMNCQDYYNGIKCSWWWQGAVGGSGGASEIFQNFVDSRSEFGFEDYYVVIDGYMSGQNAYTSPWSTIGSYSQNVPYTVWRDGAGAGLGDIHWSGAISSNNRSFYLYLAIPAWGNYDWRGDAYIMPQVVIPTSVPGSGGEDVNQPITGNVCDAVIPFNPDLVPDFDLFVESPSVCTIIPYFEVSSLIPEWLNPFDTAWGVFPASTLCYHTIDFKNQYILNTSISISTLASLFLAVWAFRKFTNKAA